MLGAFGPDEALERLLPATVQCRLTERERMVATELFKLLARREESAVRRSFVEHIKASPLLPRTLALSLAQDIESVAVPILRSSLVLTDEDLVSIIRSGSTIKQLAIAERESLSESVSGALIETGKRDVVALLLANEGAEISEASYQALLDAFADRPEIQKLMVERAVLPVEIQERLVCIVCDELRTRLIERHAIPAGLADQLTSHGRERALVQSLAALSKPQEVEAATMRLYLKGALTPTLLLRALCGGQLELFGAGIATLARVSSVKAQQALREQGTPALCDLYKRSNLPDNLQKAFQIALEVVLDARRTGSGGKRSVQEARIVEELVRAYHRLNPDSLECVFHQLGRVSQEDELANRL